MTDPVSLPDLPEVFSGLLAAAADPETPPHLARLASKSYRAVRSLQRENEELRAAATRYVFACEWLPFNVVVVERRGTPEQPWLYCVRTEGDPHDVYNAEAGEWEWEPLPSSRTELFIRQTRYPLDRALAIAREMAVLSQYPDTARDGE